MWLLSSEAFAKMEQCVSAGLTISAQQQSEFIESSNDNSIMTVAGDTARIKVDGILTESPDIFSRYFGGGNTTYRDIISALASADSDPSVVNAEMFIGSPGGTIDGLFGALTAIQMFSKPLIAVVSNNAESAAYALASQADEIVATNPMARFGSVGVVVRMFSSENVIEIASTNAPKKRPDITTEEGKSVIREELDAVHEVFADAIATGRGLSVNDVNANFAQGASVVAADAKKKGMIDSIEIESLRSIPTMSAISNTNQEVESMDLNKLKAEHPVVYAEATAVGINEERDRVNGHLTMGEACGDMAIATGAIKEGSAMTATMQASYMAAGMNRKDLTARSDDDDDLGAIDGASSDEGVGSDDDIVASTVERLLGTSTGDKQ